MEQYNPPHPGAFIERVYLKPGKLLFDEVAAKLQVNDIQLTDLLNGCLDVSPELALRLSKLFGRSPKSWLLMQENFNIWKASNSN